MFILLATVYIIGYILMFICNIYKVESATLKTMTYGQILHSGILALVSWCGLLIAFFILYDEIKPLQRQPFNRDEK